MKLFTGQSKITTTIRAADQHCFSLTSLIEASRGENRKYKKMNKTEKKNFLLHLPSHDNLNFDLTQVPMQAFFFCLFGWRIGSYGNCKIDGRSLSFTASPFRCNNE